MCEKAAGEHNLRRPSAVVAGVMGSGRAVVRGTARFRPGADPENLDRVLAVSYTHLTLPTTYTV